MAAQKIEAYAPAEGLVAVHQTIDGKDYVMDVPEGAVELWAQSGWTKASVKVAKAAENKEE